MKRFKAEKAKIVGCDNSITSVAFQKELLADHPLFGELMMKEDPTLVEKHRLWDEARRVDKVLEQPRKESAMAQKKEDGNSPTKAGRRPSVGIPRPQKARRARITLSS